MLPVTSIESCVACDEYRILCLSRVSNLLLPVTSVEFCVVSDEYRNLVLSSANIEIFV